MQMNGLECQVFYKMLEVMLLRGIDGYEAYLEQSIAPALRAPAIPGAAAVAVQVDSGGVCHQTSCSMSGPQPCLLHAYDRSQSVEAAR